MLHSAPENDEYPFLEVAKLTTTYPNRGTSPEMHPKRVHQSSNHTLTGLCPPVPISYPESLGSLASGLSPGETLGNWKCITGVLPQDFYGNTMQTVTGQPIKKFNFFRILQSLYSFCQSRMYADDTHITYSSSDLHSMQSSLNRDLSNIHKWLLCNKLTLNTTKTEFMLIGSRQKLGTLSESLELSIDNVPVKQVSTTKSLGILIDDNMAWHSHIDKLSKKIASGIGAIKRIKPFVSPEILHYIYNALVQPYFDYCSIVWGNCGKTLSEKLQKLQNRAARILTSSSYDADAGYLLQQLSWKDLIAQRQTTYPLCLLSAIRQAMS